MDNMINRIAEDMTKTSPEQMWAGFQYVAFALYDEKLVYLFNHPNYPAVNEKPYCVLTRTDSFIAETLILFEGHPTAIANLSLHNDYEGLFSTLVHELFHGYQYIKGEKRFPNELLGIMYPIQEENVEARNQERKALHDAFMADSREQMLHDLCRFIALREKREELIGEALEYENRIETVEGPAIYLEAKAKSLVSPLSFGKILEYYAAFLVDPYDSSFQLRRSCYYTGIFLSLILDKVAPAWKESFMETDKTLYAILKEALFGQGLGLPEVKLSLSGESRNIVREILEKREQGFDEFYKKPGTRVCILGELTAKGIDPMNIIRHGDKLLHKHYLKVAISQEEYLFKQPVVAFINKDYRQMKELHLILNNKPVETKESLILDGIGEIKGTYKKKGDILYLYPKE
ncbi:hypothetical protein [Neobacillus sp. YIM B06451]|uniref:hypothetical protein n=1 Tax=Neobacillus sp. YIM B06451 TaxID=3070994 RepID=UPI00292CDDF2|nr:hypothetical protein [Neobacillus sp. YIM B06451]